MSTVGDCTHFEHCKRIKKGDGVIILKQPALIKQYNKNMGGVDVSDKRRLGCATSIKGLHRWWIRIFFYIIDIIISNALILHKEGAKLSGKDISNMTIKDFKQSLIELYCKNEFSKKTEVKMKHNLFRSISKNRRRCAYCSVVGNKERRTYMYCLGCGSSRDDYLYYCSPVTGRDCFAISHGIANVPLHHQMMEKMESKKMYRTKKSMRKSYA